MITEVFGVWGSGSWYVEAVGRRDCGVPVSTDDVVDCVGSDCVDTSSGCFGQDERDCACQIVSHEDHHAIIVRSVVGHGCRVGGRSVSDVDVVGVLIEHESKQGRRTGVKVGEVCLHCSSTISSEAFARVIYKNNRDRWLAIFKYKAEKGEKAKVPDHKKNAD